MKIIAEDVVRFEVADNVQIESDKGLSEEIIVRIMHKDTQIGSFKLSPFPGCCGIVVVNYMYLREEFRGSYLSDKIRELKTKVCKDLGYTVMLATNDMSNFSSVGNIFKSKYRYIFSFVNKRTKNHIGVSYKII